MFNNLIERFSAFIYSALKTLRAQPDFRLFSENGTLIEVFFEYSGLADSEKDHPDLIEKIIAGVDRYLKVFPNLGKVTVVVGGDWDPIRIADSKNELPRFKKGMPPRFDVQAALAEWESAEFKLRASDGTPILFYTGYTGLIGSEKNHPEHYKDIIAFADELKAEFPNEKYVLIGITGNWDGFGTIIPGKSLPPLKEGMPPDDQVSVKLSIQLTRRNNGVGKNGNGTKPSSLREFIAMLNHDCPNCPAVDECTSPDKRLPN